MNWLRRLGIGSPPGEKMPPCPADDVKAIGWQLRPLLDTVPGVAIMLSPEGRIIEFNREAEQVCGMTRDEVLGKNYYTLFVPEHSREAVAADIAKVLSGQPTRGFENAIRDARGEERLFAWYASRLTDGKGVPTGLVAVGLEITDRRKAEQALLREKRFSESVIDGMPGIFYFFDDQGRLLKWNRSIEDVSGYSSQEIARMVPTDFFVADDKQRIADRIAEALRTGSAQVEADLVTRDGESIPHLFTALRVKVDGRNHLLGLGIDISDRKRAEQALLFEKNFSDSVLDGMPGILYLLDAEGRMLRWNHNVEKVTGYSKEEVAGMAATDFFPDADRTRVVEAVADTLSQGSAELEADVLTRSGQTIPYYFTGLLMTVDREPHVLGVGIDISDRKRAAEALAEREHYYRSLLYSMHEEIIVIDREYRITDINNTRLVTTGIPRDEVIGRHCFEISHGYNEPCRQYGVPCSLHEVFETGEPCNCLHQHRRPDGSYVQVDILMSPLRDEAGNVTHVIEAIRDVSDLFEAQAAVRASEERFRAVIEQAGEGFLLIAPDGRIVDANRCTCESLGYTRDELLSMRIDAIDPDAVPGKNPPPDEMPTDKYLTIERRHKRKDGSTFPVEVRLGPLRIGDETFILGLARDITERKRAEERVKGLNRLEEELLAPGSIEGKTQIITDGLVAIFQADFARLWLIRPGDRCHAGCPHAMAEGPHACRNRERCLHLAASSGRYTHTDGGLHHRVPFGCYKIGRVAAAEEIGFVTNDVAHDVRVHDRHWARELGLVSFAGYKLSAADGTPVGVLALFSEHAISPDEAGLLETVAGIASQVIRTTKAEHEHKHLIRVLEATTDLVAIATPGGRLTYMNRAGRQMLGWEPDEDVSSRMIPETHPKWAADKVLNEGIRAAIRDGVWRGETAIVDRERQEIPVSQVIMAHRSPSGKLEYLSTIMRDVRERRRAEEQRQEHVRFLEHLEQIDRAIRQASDLDQMLHEVLGTVLSIFECDRAWLLFPCDPEVAAFRVPMLVTRPEHALHFTPDTAVPMVPSNRAICKALLASEAPLTFGPDGDHALDTFLTDEFQVRSLMTMAVYPKDGEPWALGMHQCSHGRRWTDGERALFHEIGRRLADGLSSLLLLRDLREREASLQSIFRAAPAGMGVSVDRVLRQVNDRICEMVGRPRDELLGQCSRILYPTGEEFERVGVVARASTLDGGAGATETRWIHRDGHIIDILLSWTPVDPHGQSAAYTFAALDITERKEAERKESEARRIAEAVAEAGLQYLEAARIQNMARHIVQRAIEIIGAEMGFVGERLPNGSLRLLALSDVPWRTPEGGPLDDDARQAVTEPEGYVLPKADNVLFRALETGEVLMSNTPVGRQEWHGVPEWHPVVNSLLLVPLKVTNEVVGLLGVANRPGGFSEDQRRDLESFAPTAALAISRSRSEQERLNLEEQLRQAQKMEAVGQLAGGVAHDFNNLLQAIHGYTYLAMTDLDPESDSYTYAEEVMKASERAAALTQQLLAFSRRQVIQPKAVDLNHAVSDMMRMLRRVIGEHIELSVVLGQHVKPVHADTGQIGQVLINLCVNARDAMAGGGRLTIETGSATLDAAFCESHPWAAEGGYGLITVTDTGAGMTPEVQLRVFEPFFTTKELGRGTGLGLATVYGIVKQHGGLVDVSSEPGHGSSFRVYLPMAADAVVATGQHDAAEPPLGGTETILLAEDEETVRDMATEVLERAGYKVLVARDGEEAVALFQENASEVAMAVLDVVMPRLSGRAACEKMQAIRPSLPVLFSSGYSFTALDGGFLGRAKAQTIPKPYTPREFLKKVRQALDRGKPGV